jgi:sugar lactone lactonase YvrE
MVPGSFGSAPAEGLVEALPRHAGTGRVILSAVEEVLLPGAVKYPEGPRWRDGTLWFSDQLGKAVLRLDRGIATVVAELPRPSGLGYLPDGSLLVATMAPPLVVRVPPRGSPETVVDLSPLAVTLNDMVTDDHGRSYVDAYGADPWTDGSLVRVDTDGEYQVVAAGLTTPNGLAITPDGRTLVVSETGAGCITAFDVATDGTLSGRRVWAAVDGMAPDGLCLDANGDVWVASYSAGEFLHVREGGEVLRRRLEVPGRWALACALGGDDGRTLFLCSSETTVEGRAAGEAIGHLESARLTTLEFEISSRWRAPYAKRPHEQASNGHSNRLGDSSSEHLAV